ncbi:MAG: 16S rRNA (adenine(1518)-N(6)/adenine(1519)-N(6))-dimethyltransferase, partial [Candidatus Thiodiazotropha taylori]|nr:16S rRNA (adenine(1518)-N(6)/adenine(1519)-N(6))-dimethyltransferase [Candidatus Thiodiazotropha taylori]
VDRMGADPGSKSYGRLSIMLQARAEVTPLFSIGPGAFKPAPKVDSAFVRLVPYDHLPYQIDNWDHFSQVVAEAFSQRRKTLRNCLKKTLTSEAIESVGIDPGIRAESLPIEAFAKLAKLLDRP